MAEPTIVCFDEDREQYRVFINTNFPDEIYFPELAQEFEKMLTRLPARCLVARTDTRPDNLQATFEIHLIERVAILTYRTN
jgi:hypothetical protein